MIDVQNGKYSFASELSKAKASAPWAALHISSAHAICGLSEINHHMKHTREKKINYICSLIEGCPKKGKFTSELLTMKSVMIELNKRPVLVMESAKLYCKVKQKELEDI